jgi:hypothetical protein
MPSQAPPTPIRVRNPYKASQQNTDTFPVHFFVKSSSLRVIQLTFSTTPRRKLFNRHRRQGSFPKGKWRVSKTIFLTRTMEIFLRHSTRNLLINSHQANQIAANPFHHLPTGLPDDNPSSFGDHYGIGLHAGFRSEQAVGKI